MDQTRHLIGELPKLLREIGATSLLDVPCGDFNWMSHVDLGDIRYTGGDIVPALIESNRKRHQRDGVSFEVIDLTKDALPTVEVLMVRDCLVHLSFDLIEKALKNLKKSDITWLLTTSFPKHEVNEDIVTGQWRRLNLEKAPFNFPPMGKHIVEGYFGEGDAHHDKALALWKVSDLPDQLG